MLYAPRFPLSVEYEMVAPLMIRKLGRNPNSTVIPPPLPV